MNNREDLSYKHPLSFVTGKGLGVSYSSLTQLGFDLWPKKSLGQANLELAVNVVNQNIIIKDRMLKFQEATGLLEIGYIYNSNIAAVENRWRLSLKEINPKRINKSDPIILTEEDGHQTEYVYDDKEQIYKAPSFGNGTPFIKYNENRAEWEWYHPGTGIYEYYETTTGKIKWRIDSIGNYLTFVYNLSETRICKIISTCGDCYYIDKYKNEYGWSLQILMQNMSGSSPVLLQQYELDNRFNLKTSCTIPSDSTQDYKYTTVYKYWEDSYGNISDVIQTDGTKIRFEYKLGVDSKRKLERIKYIDDDSTNTVNYIVNDSTNLNTYSINYLGYKYAFKTDNEARLLEYVSVEGYGTDYPNKLSISYTDGQVDTLVYPNNSTSRFEFKHPLKVKTTEIKPDGTTLCFVYDQDKQYPCLIAMGKKINNKFVFEHHIYNKNISQEQKIAKSRLELKISPEGCIKQNLYKGTFIKSIREFKNIRYNNLDIKEITLEKLLAKIEQQLPATINQTDLGHNNRGQLLSISKYISLDENLKPIETCLSNETIFPDYAGNCRQNTILQKIEYSNKKFARTENEYDEFSRLKKSINALEKQTKIQIDDVKRQIITTYPNGSQEIKQFSNQGALISKQLRSLMEDEKQIKTRIVNFKFRNAPYPVVIEETDDIGSYNLKSYRYFDYESNLVYEISHTGYVTEYFRDQKKNYISKINYATPIDLKIFSDSRSLPSNFTIELQLKSKVKDPNNKHTYVFNTNFGKPKYIIDGERSCVQYFYDELGRESGVVKYDGKLSEVQITQLTNGSQLEKKIEAKDRFTRKFYNNDDYLIAEKDAEDYITEYVRDAANYIVKKVVYHAPVQNVGTTTALEEIRPQLNGKISNTYYFRNGKGEVVYELDAENYFTKYEYFNNGLKALSRRYATKIDPKVLNLDKEYPDLTKIINYVPKETEQDEIYTYDYDLLDREIKKLDSNGKLSETEFDDMGNKTLTSESDAFNSKETNGDFKRQRFCKFDKWNQLIAEANPYIAQKIQEIKDSKDSDKDKEEKIKQIWKTQTNRQEYNSYGLHIQTTNTLGNRTIYFYDQENRPWLRIDPTGAVTETLYDQLFRTQIITRAYSKRLPGEQFKNLKGGWVDENIKKLIVSLEDENHDKTNIYKYDKRGYLIEHTDPNKNTTKFDINAFGQIENETKPIDGAENVISTRRQYNRKGLETNIVTEAMKLKELVAGNSIYDSQSGYRKEVTKEYKNPFGNLTLEKDSLGHQRKIEQDLLGRDTLVTNSFGKTVEYKYDAFRLYQKIDELQRLTEYLYDQKKRETQIKQEGQLLSTKTDNVFGQATSIKDGLNNEEIRSHEPDGQINSVRTPCGDISTYNHNTEAHLSNQTEGQLFTIIERNAAEQEKERTERANTSNDQKAETKSSYTSKTEPDAFGRPETVTDPLNIVQTSRFDGCDNRTTQTIKTEKSTVISSSIYNSVNDSKADSLKEEISEIKAVPKLDNKNEPTLPYQINSKKERDPLSRLTGVTIDPKTESNPKGLNLASTRTLDLRDRPKTIIDEEGNVTRIFHDEEDRKRFEIDPKLGIIENTYNDAGEKITTRVYGVPFNLQLNDNSTILEVENATRNLQSSKDQIVKYFYQPANHERFRVEIIMDNNNNAIGIVHETRYDAALRPITTIHYGQTLTASDLKDLDTENLAKIMQEKFDNKLDKVSYSVLDGLGRPRYIVDADGYVTEKRYQGKNEIAEIIYSSPIPLPNDGVLTEDLLKKNLKENDNKNQHHYKIYNELNQIIFEVNPKGAVIGYKNNYYGDILEECRYKPTIDQFADYEDLKLKLKTFESNRSRDRVTEHKYDQLRRKTETINPRNYSKIYTPHLSGNNSDVTDEAKKIWRNEFDSAGRVKDEFTPKIGEGPEIKTHKEYFKNGKIKSITEAKGTALERTTVFEYDPCGNLLSKAIQPNLNKKDSKEIILFKAAYDSRNNRVTHQNQDGEWTFKIFDNQNREIYSINQMGVVTEKIRDALGKVKTKRIYDKSITIKSDYYNKGISIEELLANLNKDIYKEKHLDYTQRGDLKSKSAYVRVDQTNKKLECKEVKAHDNKKAEALPADKKYKTDASGNIISTAVLTDEKNEVYSEHYFYYDKNNKRIGEIDSRNYLTLYVRNVHGEVEDTLQFHEPLKDKPSLEWNETDLKSIAENLNSTLNRHEKKTYNSCGQIESEKLVGVITQSAELQTNPIKKPNTNDNKIEVKEEKISAYTWIENKPQDVGFDYLYNATEDKIATVDPNGGKKQFFYDERRQKIAETGITRTTKDEKGKEVKLTPLSHFKVNELNQVESKTDFKSGTDLEKCIGIPQPIQKDEQLDQVTAFGYDDLNQQTSISKDATHLNLTQQKKLNQKGLPLVEIDANGRKTRLFYDDLNRLRFKVSPSGSVYEENYDSYDNVISKRLYDQSVNPDELKDSTNTPFIEEMVKNKKSNADNLTYQFFDANNHLRYVLKVNEYWDKKLKKSILKGIITENSFDSADRIHSQTDYDTPLEIELEKITNYSLDDISNKLSKAITQEGRTTLYFRDQAGNPIVVIDPMGHVIEQEFDRYGKIIKQTKYAKSFKEHELYKLKSLTEIKLEINKLSHVDDRTTYTIWNAFGKKSYEIDAIGGVIKYGYDKCGNQIGQTAYNERIKLNSTLQYSDLLGLVKNIKEDLENDRTNIYKRDEASQIIEVKDSDPQYADAYGFDIFGNKIAHKNRAGNITEFKFDGANRQTHVVSPVFLATETSIKDGKLIAKQELKQNIEETKYDNEENPKEVIKGKSTSDERKVSSEFDDENRLKAMIIKNVNVDDPGKKTDFNNRPEQKVDVLKTTIYDNKKQKVYECDENGEFCFFIYDSQGNRIFAVNHSGAVIGYAFNAHGDEITETKYANTLQIDLSQYKDKGVIPRSIIESNLVPDVKNDRTIDKEYNKNSKLKSVLQPEVYCLSSVTALKAHSEQTRELKSAFLQKCSPQTCYEYNTYNETISTKKKITPTQWSETNTYYNKNGKPVAVVTPEHYLTLKEYNTFNEQELISEYAERLKLRPVITATIEEIKQLLLISKCDHHVKSKYDRRGFEKEIHEIQLQAEEVVFDKDGIPSIPFKKIDVLRQFVPTPTLKIKEIIDENGNSEYYFYNSIDALIAQIDLPRELFQKGEIGIPLTLFGVNIHGKAIATKKFKEGLNSDDKITAETLLTFKSNPENMLDLSMEDKRGLVILKQDPENNLTASTYTKGGQEARRWFTRKICDLADRYAKNPSNIYPIINLIDAKETKSVIPQNLAWITCLDEQIFEYRFKEMISTARYRNHLLQMQTKSKPNTFNEIINEGPGPNSGYKDEWAIDNSIDQCGRVWKSNSDHGKYTVTLHDLQGNPVAAITSPEIDLKDLNMDEINELIVLHPEKINITLTELNLEGKPTEMTLPSICQSVVTKNLPLELQVSDKYPELGAYSLSWDPIKVGNVLPFLKIRKRGAQGDFFEIKKPIKTLKGRTGIDLAGIIDDVSPDVYEYVIDYYLYDPKTGQLIDGKKEKPLFKTTGLFSCNIGDEQKSVNVIVSAIDNNTVKLNGNIKNITSVNVVDQPESKKIICSLPVDHTKQECKVDISSLNSGRYHFIPITSGQDSLAATLAFDAHTNKPNTSPFYKEFDYQVDIHIVDKILEIKLAIPDEFSQKDLLLSCEYKNDAHKILKLENVIVKYDTQKNGYLVTVDEDIKSIEKLTLSIVVKENTLINLYKNQPPIIPTINKKIVNNQLHNLKRKITKKDVVLSTQNTEIKLGEQTFTHEDHLKDNDYVLVNEAGEPEPLVSQFQTHTMMQINVPEVQEVKMFEFFDTSEDIQASWNEIKAIAGFYDHNIFIDVTSMLPGNYPYRLNGAQADYLTANKFLISHGTFVFSSNTYSPTPEQKNVSYKFIPNRWGNPTRVIDTTSAIKDYEYNTRQQPTLITHPEITVMNNENAIIRTRPQEKFGYDRVGYYLGKTNANGNTSARILNNAGQLLVSILGDGTQLIKPKYDALSCPEGYLDARNNEWKFKHNRNSVITETLSPEGNFTKNLVNEEGKVIKATKRGYDSYHGFDILSNPFFQCLPRGNWFRDTFDRNSEILNKTTSGGHSASWTRNYFGILEDHIDLGGNKIEYKYNFEIQLKSQKSSEFKPGTNYYDCRKIQTPYIFEIQGVKYIFYQTILIPVLSHVPAQDLEFKYSNSRLSEIIDHANKMRVLYRYDTESRKISYEVYKNDELIHLSRSEYNEMGWVKLMLDSIMTMSITPDFVGNRKLVTSTLSSPDSKSTSQESYASQYDKAERPIILNGVLDGRTIRIGFDKGIELSYKNNIVDKERRLRFPDGQYSTNSFGVNKDGLLTNTHTELTPKLIYDVNRDQKDDLLNESSIIVSQKIANKSTYKRNQNDNIIVQTEIKDNNVMLVSNTTDVNEFDQPLKQTVQYPHDSVTDNNKFTYLGFDQMELSSIHTDRQTKSGKQNGDSQFLYDSNRTINSITGAEIQSENETKQLTEEKISSRPDEETKIILYVTAPDSLVIKKLVLPINFLKGVMKTSIPLYNANGQPLGEYQIGQAQQQISLLDNVLGYIRASLRGSNITIFQKKSELADLIRNGAILSANMRNIPKTTLFNITDHILDSDIDFQQAPENYVTESDDETCESISKHLYDGSPDYALMIAFANGISVTQKIKKGTTIQRPRLVPERNKVDNFIPYATFKQKLMQQIMPHVVINIPDQDDTPFLKVLAEVIVVGLAAMYCPALAGVALNALTGAGLVTLTAGTASTAVITNIATAISASVIDAAGQTICVATGLRSHFSLKEASQVGMTVGISNGVTAVLGNNVLSAAASNCITQLVQMKLKMQQKFNVQSVLNAMGAQVIGAEIGSKLSNATPQARFAATMLESTANCFLTAAIYQRDPSIPDMIAQAIGAGSLRLAAEANMHSEIHSGADGLKSKQVVRESQYNNVKSIEHKQSGRLSSQSESKYQPTLFGSSRNTPKRQANEDKYNFNQSISDSYFSDEERQEKWSDQMFNSPNNIHKPKNSHAYMNRAMGVVQALGGVAEVAGGIAGGIIFSETGIGAVVGGVVATRGIDNIFTGIKSAWKGTDEETNFEIVASTFGISKQAAMGIELGVDVLSINPAKFSQTAIKLGDKAIENSARFSKYFGQQLRNANDIVLFSPSRATPKSLLSQVGSVGDIEKTAIDISTNKANIQLLDPNDIRFSQPTVSPNLSKGGTIESLVIRLKSGMVKPTDIPLIRVVIENGKYIALDNRRLYAFNWANIKEIPVEIVSLNNKEINILFNKRFKPIRFNDDFGRYVVVVKKEERGKTIKELYEHNKIYRKQYE